MSPPSERNNQPEPSGAELLNAYNRNLRGVQSIVASLDIPVGLTPKKEIWRLNKTRLYRYQPVRPPEQRHPIPLLLVYALINKPFIFDLAPGRSFIEFILEQGFDVYLLDWGSPGPEDKKITFDDYVTQYLRRAVRKLRRHSASGEFSMLGYCIGGTLSVIYTALYPEKAPRNLITLAPPMDFQADNRDGMAVWVDEANLDVDKAVDSLGNIPGEMIKMWAKMLKPMENFIGSYVTLWKQLGDEAAVRGWQAVNRWVEDVIPFAGEAFRQLVKEYMRENQLMRGVHVIDGKVVDVGEIQAAFLNVVAQYDHIVTLSQSTTIVDKVSSLDKELRIIPSTHVGMMASHRAKYKLWPELVDWLAPRSQLEPFAPEPAQ
jgi:polyhydroxyalkanoate synthase